ncbi:MAG: nuclear transport factor 2 family protein [Lautropia sp.]
MNVGLRREIEADCARVLQQQVHCLDERRYEELVDLFLPDGVWHRGGETFRGRTAILGAMRARPTGWIVRHVVSNVLITTDDAANASAVLYLTAYLFEGGPADETPSIPGPRRLVIVTARLARAAGGWQIAEQRNRREFEFSCDRASNGPT